MRVYSKYTLIWIVLLGTLSSCSLFGDKKNATADQVFQQGQIDPNLVTNSVGYVPLYPFITGVTAPIDVFVGYDEMTYVVEDMNPNDIKDNRLSVFDPNGKRVYSLVIPGATDVTQDRRLHVFVAGRKMLNDSVNFAAIFHIINVSQGNAQFLDTLIHPNCDASRAQTSFRGADDVAVQFTGLATLYDNTLYVSRTGPRNDVNSTVAVPDNGVLVFDKNMINTGYSQGLNPNESSLKSCVGLSAIATNAAPPQRLQGVSTSKSFFSTLSDKSKSIEFRALAINVVDNPDAGTQYAESGQFLNFDFSKANRFMYEPSRFKHPVDCYIAPDQLNYYFVVDDESDSVYIFTNQGFEGVNPPANSTVKKQIIASFGGIGKDGSNTGPFNFNDPSGVCYYNRTLYVADKGNNRICRYKLNVDLQ